MGLPLLRRLLRVRHNKTIVRILKSVFWLILFIGLILTVWGFSYKKVKDPPPPPEKVEGIVQTQEDLTDELHLSQLENFFARYKCSDPDYDIAGNYLEYAHHYGIDWRLLPAISVKESTCGKHELYNNWWGFGSYTGLKHFKNIYYGMDYIMSKFYDQPYVGKSETQLLQAYGPHPGGKPSTTYYKEVLKLIKEIGSQ